MFNFAINKTIKKYALLLVVFTVLASTFLGDFLFEEILISVEEAYTSPSRGIIVIDAGHGGEDSGAIGKSGVLEKDLNLLIANQVGEFLEKEGFVVVYTRKEDKLLYKEEENIKGIRKISDLKNRCEIANSYDDAIFVSIHMNSFGQEKYSGLQVYYSPNDEESPILGQTIQNSVRELVQQNNTRKIKKGQDVYVLENIRCRGVLIECGFLSNSNECENLCKKEYQKRLSYSIVCGIIDYIDKYTEKE